VSEERDNMVVVLRVHLNTSESRIPLESAGRIRVAPGVTHVTSRSHRTFRYSPMSTEKKSESTHHEVAPGLGHSARNNTSGMVRVTLCEAFGANTSGAVGEDAGTRVDARR
jgi:hypothetical protein